MTIRAAGLVVLLAGCSSNEATSGQLDGGVRNGGMVDASCSEERASMDPGTTPPAKRGVASRETAATIAVVTRTLEAVNPALSST